MLPHEPFFNAGSMPAVFYCIARGLILQNDASHNDSNVHCTCQYSLVDGLLNSQLSYPYKSEPCLWSNPCIWLLTIGHQLSRGPHVNIMKKESKWNLSPEEGARSLLSSVVVKIKAWQQSRLTLLMDGNISLTAEHNALHYQISLKKDSRFPTRRYTVCQKCPKVKIDLFHKCRMHKQYYEHVGNSDMQLLIRYIHCLPWFFSSNIEDLKLFLNCIHGDI